jgi:RNA polymerase sigma-70 factor (ECF subfamily)
LLLAGDERGQPDHSNEKAHVPNDTPADESSHGVRETIGRAPGYSSVSARVSDIESLVAAHRQGVYRYLCRIVGKADTAHDLTQEVFLRVSRAGVPETNDAGQRAWIFRIARNLALNHVRDGRRRPEPGALVDRGTSATQELQLTVRQALASLPELDRDVFLLRELVGLSYEEVAEACGLSESAVRNRLHRARLTLRQALGTHVDDRVSGGIQWKRGPNSD